MKPIYLDYNASTPSAPEVVDAMRPLLCEHYGNPSSPPRAAAPTKRAIDRASGQVAVLLGCAPSEIVFTSGGTEANDPYLNGHPTERLPNTLNVSFAGRIGSEVREALECVTASTGSACHSGRPELSPVLKVMGVPEGIGPGTVRFSPGRWTTSEELDQVLSLFRSATKPGHG